MEKLPSWEETEEIKNESTENLPSWDETEEVGGVSDQIEGAVKGAAQGASFGFIDEVAALGDAALYGLANLPVSNPSKIGKHLSKTVDRYDRALESQRQSEKQAKERAPGAYVAGELVGGVASSMAMPATKLGRVGTAAMESGLYGVGSGEGVEERLQQGTIGAGVGAVGGKVLSEAGDLVGKAVKYGKDKLGRFAENQTLKSVGATGQDLVKKNSRGFIEDAAKEIHEEGLNKISLVGNEDEILNKVSSKLKNIGEEVGNLKQKLDTDLGKVVDVEGVGTKLMQEVGDLPQLSGNKPMLKILQDITQDLNVVADDAGKLGLDDLWKVRDSVGKRAGWDKSKLSLSDENMLARDMYGKINKVVNEVIETVAGDAPSAQQLKKLNKQYNIYSKLKGYASSNKMKNETKSFVPFKSLVSGGIVGGTMGPVGVAAGMAINAARERYGQQVLARGAMGFEKLLEKASSKTPHLNKFAPALKQATPERRRVLMNTLLKQNKGFKEEYEALKKENQED